MVIIRVFMLYITVLCLMNLIDFHEELKQKEVMQIIP